MNQADRGRVQDDDLGRTAYQLPDPAFEIERQALDGGGRSGRVEDGHVDVTPGARRSSRDAAEQVGGNDPAGLYREELTEGLLDGGGRHAGIIRPPRTTTTRRTRSALIAGERKILRYRRELGA